jgi:RNA polymerase sigma factor (sigma-70 family)
MSDEDEALVRGVAAGSEIAFNRLVDRHQQAVRTFLRRLLRDEGEAEDVAQDTFLAVWRNAGAYRGKSSVRSWLCGIAFRKAQSLRRSWFRRRVRDDAWQEVRDLETGAGLSHEEAFALQQALAQLPIEQRAALALCLGGEVSHAEAAEALGLPLGTVKSHIGRGRKKMLASLGEQG